MASAGEQQRRRGGDDQFQRQQREAQADAETADMAAQAVLAGAEQADAQDQAERREPAEIERQDLRGDCGADISAQHHAQRDGTGDQAAAGEGGDDQGGGRAGLQQRGDAEAGDETGKALAQRAAEIAAQLGAEGARHAGAHHAHAPEQKGDAGHQVKQKFGRASDAVIMRPPVLARQFAGGGGRKASSEPSGSGSGSRKTAIYSNLQGQIRIITVSLHLYDIKPKSLNPAQGYF